MSDVLNLLTNKNSQYYGYKLGYIMLTNNSFFMNLPDSIPKAVWSVSQFVFDVVFYAKTKFKSRNERDGKYRSQPDLESSIDQLENHFVFSIVRIHVRSTSTCVCWIHFDPNGGYENTHQKIHHDNVPAWVSWVHSSFFLDDVCQRMILTKSGHK